MDDLPSDTKARIVDLSYQINEPSLRSSGALEYARRRRLGEDLETLLTQIRAVPGHEEFGITSLEQVLRAGEQGPVVILVSHGWKCIAYALTKRDSKDSFKITAIDLDVKRPQLRQYISDLDDANDHARRGIERGVMTADSDDNHDQEPDVDSGSDSETTRAYRRPRTRGVMEKVLKPLWYTVAKPVISGLNITVNHRLPLHALH